MQYDITGKNKRNRTRRKVTVLGMLCGIPLCYDADDCDRLVWRET